MSGKKAPSSRRLTVSRSARAPTSSIRPSTSPISTSRRTVGFPGEYPFTAGSYASSVPGSGPVTGGYHIGGGGGLVRAGRYSGYGTAEDTRDYYQREIARGRKGGPNVAFDLPYPDRA